MNSSKPYTAAMETLNERATLMRESIQKMQSITDSMVAKDYQPWRPQCAPMQSRTHLIRRAHENIDKMLKAAEVILGQFDLSRQAEAKILRGPREDLESYLEVVDQLSHIISFFTVTKGFKSGMGAVNQANNLLAKAISKLEEEFRQILTAYSKPVEPDRLFDCLPNSMRPSAGSPRDGEPNEKKPSDHQNQNKITENVFYQPAFLGKQKRANAEN